MMCVNVTSTTRHVGNMTQDELFTAIYLVCGALPSKPESQKNIRSYSTTYRRKLPDGRVQNWVVDDEQGESYLGSRALYDPAYQDYFDKACRVAMISYGEFDQYIAWAEAHEQQGQKV
jgi:hypothetical protein